MSNVFQRVPTGYESNKIVTLAIKCVTNKYIYMSTTTYRMNYFNKTELQLTAVIQWKIYFKK